MELELRDNPIVVTGLFVQVYFLTGGPVNAGWMTKSAARAYCAQAMADPKVVSIMTSNRSEDYSWLRGKGWN